MPELQIGDILLMPIIVGIVEGLKKFANLPSRWAPVATAVLAAVGYGLMLWANINPEMVVWIQHGLKVIILALSAAGLYATGKFYITPRT
jgi:hypothetical protein